MALAGLGDGAGKTVGLERELRQPVVAAVIRVEIGPHAKRFQPGHPADIGVDLDGFKIAGRETRAPVAHRLGHSKRSGTQTIHDGIAADGERLHSPILTAVTCRPHFVIPAAAGC